MSACASSFRNQILARVEQMKAIQAELDPYPMVLHEEFDYKPFWAEVLGSDGLEASEAQLPNRLQVNALHTTPHHDAIGA